MIASDITNFFARSTRGTNDKVNKIRELILKQLYNPPTEYIEHPEFGKQWLTVSQAWKESLQKVAEMTSVPPYSTIDVELKAGRKFNYDAEILYKNETEVVATRKIEFKYGGSSISNLPQFLSLQVKVGLFPETYEKYWYDNFLDTYIACDTGITEQKPPYDEYSKNISSANSDHPFFIQLKSREETNKKEKQKVVNDSIKEYLTKYGSTIDIASFCEKVKTTQDNKIYLLWSSGKFWIDQLSSTEMSNMEFHSIKNGNLLQIKSENVMYKLLLRWRNHKGILNPAWQISLKREATNQLV
jgi:hypothetical protein